MPTNDMTDYTAQLQKLVGCRHDNLTHIDSHVCLDCGVVGERVQGSHGYSYFLPVSTAPDCRTLQGAMEAAVSLGNNVNVDADKDGWFVEFNGRTSRDDGGIMRRVTADDAIQTICRLAVDRHAANA